MPQLTIAIAGCAHGEMEKIYATLKDVEAAEGKKADILLCCGDFQSVRNLGDLRCMHVPPKYQQLMSFYKYYSGEAVAPVLTLFVGGNHEASNFLAELPHGGWVAPNIFYMGYASVLRFKGLRIAGLSGIAGKRPSEYHSGHWECPPYNDSSKVSAYHIRSLDVFRLRQLATSVPPVDVFLSHDWPAGITAYGDERWLVGKKPYFAQEVAEGALGNPYTLKLLQALKPSYWFAAHLHVKFPALVPHDDGRATRFLALDKCLPHRGFLQLIDVDVPSERPGQDAWLSYDAEWLAVLQSTDELMNAGRGASYMPGPGIGSGRRFHFAPTEEEVAGAVAAFPGGDLTVPSNFQITALPHKESDNRGSVRESYQVNPQSSAFCERLGIQNLNAVLFERNKDRLPRPAEESPCPTPPAPPSASGEEDLFGAFERPEPAALPTSVLSKLRLPPPKAQEEPEKDPALEGFSPPPLKRSAEEESTSLTLAEPSAADRMKRRNIAQYDDAEED